MRRAGFTLIELAFVTAILVILLAASIPKFQHTADRLRIEQSMFHLVQTLRAAREQAVAENRPLVWVWDGHARESHLETVVKERLEKRGTVQASLASSVTLQINRAGRPVDCQCVRFFPDGTSDPTTTLTMNSQERVYTVTIHEATGQACLAAGTVAC